LQGYRHAQRSDVGPAGCANLLLGVAPQFALQVPFAREWLIRRHRDPIAGRFPFSVELAPELTLLINC
jgi:hypothetical protein